MEDATGLSRKQVFLPLSQGGRHIRGFVLGIATNVNTHAYWCDILEEYGAGIDFRQRCLLFEVNNKTRCRFVNERAVNLEETANSATVYKQAVDQRESVLIIRKERKNTHRKSKAKLKIYKWKRLVMGNVSFKSINHRDNITLARVLVILLRN